MSDGTQAIEFATRQEVAEIKKEVSDLKTEVVALRKEDAEIKSDISKLDSKFDAFITKQTGIVGAIAVLAQVAIQLWGGK